uniref:Selenoprotein F n=1 Tax=Sinocyclocheilus grahami TaxID=75366 RepID=A0A672JRJ2_SINGR
CSQSSQIPAPVLYPPFALISSTACFMCKMLKIFLACREMGFSSNLLCSSCDLLGQFSLGQLDLPCRQCCQEEGVFLVAASFLWLYIPSAFVRSDKPKMFRGLQIKYVRGSDPVLKLLDDNGNIAEELSILKWNTDSVEEFLSEKLEQI